MNRTKRKIFEIAMKLFSEKGYDATSIEEITATDLCKMMKMQKSLMNRTLNSLEEKDIVKRVRSTNDKRKIIVILCDENNIYHKQHRLVLDYVEAIVENLEGLEDSIIPIFESVTKATNLIK